GWFTPAGYSSTVYSYKRPGEIDKTPAQPLWITVLVWEHLRNCMGTSAQLYGNICATVWEHLRNQKCCMGTSAQPDQGICLYGNICAGTYGNICAACPRHTEVAKTVR